MKFTLSILKQFLVTDASLAEIALSLTAIGLEVEEITDQAARLKEFVVAEIIDAKPHPNADKLQICQVQTASEVLQIVCGAPNARKNLKVVLAHVGVLIPNGNFKIKNSEIRGISSYGMLASEQELLIGNASSGIIELPNDAEVGKPFAEYYGIADPMIHINVTPNRGDALSVLGIARDLAAAGIGTFKYPAAPDFRDSFKTDFAVQVDDKEACPLFAIREIKNLNSNAVTPPWLKQFLNNIGIDSISPIVDITNYTCIVLGQPMHAYDAAKINRQLRVKKLENKQNFTGLNNKNYVLESGDLIIESNDQIQCLAGIIGGADSAVGEQTNNIILEAACFDGVQISKTGRRTNIESDSRYRFERKIDAGFSVRALDFATQMILDICGGDASDVVMEKEDKFFAPKSLTWSARILEKTTGLLLENSTIIDILTRLGFASQLHGQDIELQIPSWRHDISIKEDIVEEITRIYGYDNIPEISLPKSDLVYIPSKNQQIITDAKRLLAVRGYDEVVSWSFTHSALAKYFTELKKELFLLNPISSDLDYMRPSILPNLLKMLAKNINRSFKNQCLFEVGPVFTGTKPEDEIVMAAGIRCGFETSANPHQKARLVDPYDIKADLEYLLNFTGMKIEKFQLGKASSYFHPTRSSSLNLGKNKIAEFGELHPQILKAFDIDLKIMAFELNLTSIPRSKPKFGMREAFRPSDFQVSIQDFAFVVDANQQVGDILTCVQNLDKNLIKNVNLFDVYVDNKLSEDKKSIAFSVSIQAEDRTLNEQDLNILREKIISTLAQKFGAILRGQ